VARVNFYYRKLVEMSSGCPFFGRLANPQREMTRVPIRAVRVRAYPILCCPDHMIISKSGDPIHTSTVSPWRDPKRETS